MLSRLCIVRPWVVRYCLTYRHNPITTLLFCLRDKKGSISRLINQAQSKINPISFLRQASPYPTAP